jgi:hypothetical protein
MITLFLRCLVLVLFALSIHSVGLSPTTQSLHRPTLTWILVAVIVSVWIFFKQFGRKPNRGAKQMSFRNALTKAFVADRTTSASAVGKGIYFGGVLLPPEAATNHFLIVGATGSGKTLALRMMMESVLPQLLASSDQRAVIYDVKQDVVSIIRGTLGRALSRKGMSEPSIASDLSKRIVVLNPFDRRCREWAIAEDVDSPELALQIATILIPEEQGHNRYFSDAARDLLTGVINVFIERSAGRWTFADLLVAMRSPARLEHVLSQTAEGQDLVELHLLAENTTRSVISTARSKLAPFDVVAALWGEARRSGRTISLRKFLTGNEILVLGNHQAALAPIRAINRVIFQRLTELILSQTEDESRRTWFFLDEVRKLEKLDGLDDLMTNGRSKGACVVLGFQAVEGMEAVYGKEIAGEIVSMCGSYGVLRVAGARTPQWASEVMGEHEVIQSVRSHSETLGGSSQIGGLSSTAGESEQIREKRLFLPSQFRMIPRPERGKPLCGYFCSAFLESTPYYAAIPPQDVAHRLLAAGPPEENFHPWPDGVRKRLRQWNADDYQRLGLPPLDEGRRAGPDTAAGAGGAARVPNGSSAPRGFIDLFVTAENQPRQR